jgi:branched-chain amino acid aminotransferase
MKTAAKRKPRPRPSPSKSPRNARTQRKAAAQPALPIESPSQIARLSGMAPEDRPIIYVNGRYLPKNQAAVSVYDHGLLYGDGVFEGIRVYRGRIFKLQQHMDRLWKSAQAIRLDIPISRDEMIDIQRQCIRLNNLSDAYIRLLVTRGYGTLGLDPRKCPKPGVICIADQIALYPPEIYEQGMRVVVANRPRIPVAALDPRIKSLNYLNNILAKCEGIDFGCHEVIMLNMEGYVAECSGDNIFVVKDGTLYTPPPDAGALEGITRRFVIDTLAPDCGLRCVEKMMRLDDVLAADEVFLTGSAAEIVAVTQIDQHDGKRITRSTRITRGEGPLTARLRARFRQIVTGDHVPED